MSLLQPMMVVVLLLGGMGLALLGSLKVALARRLAIDEARVGGLVSVFGFAMIPVILLAGFLTDRAGQQGVLVGGCLLMTGSLLVLATARRYPIALVAVVLLSAAWSAMINVGNVLTPIAFGGGDRARVAFATNLANVFFGIGAFLTPLAVAFLLRKAGFAKTVSLLGVLALVPAGLSLSIDFGAFQATGTAAPPSFTVLLGDPIMWLCGFALFFYGPLEAAVAAWTTTYLDNQGVRETPAALMLSGFWLAFMVARLATAFALPAGREAAFILVLALACVGVLAAMVVSRGAGLAMLLVVLAGLVFGPIFPTLLAVLLGHFDKLLHGRAVGLLFAIGGIGWTTIPILIGTYAQRTTVQRGFTVAVATAICLVAVAVALLVWTQ